MAISYLTDMRDIQSLEEFERGLPPKRPTPDHYEEEIKIAKLADELGYKTAFAPQNHASNDGFCPAPFPVLAAFARETKRIRLGTGIVQLPLNQFRRVVEEATTVDVLSHGRVTLGVGIGGYDVEYKAFGRSLDDRSKLMEEGLNFIKPGLSGDDLPDGLCTAVPPVQRPIPLIVGCHLARPFDRAVRLADGQFMTCHIDQEKDLAQRWTNFVQPTLQKYGRSPANFQLLLMSCMWASEKPEDDWNDFVGPGYLYRKKKYEEHFGTQKLPLRYQQQDSAEKEGLGDLQDRMLIDKPAKLAVRLKKLRELYPFTELICMKVQSIPQDRFAKFLQIMREQVAPVVFPEKKW